MKNGPAKKGNKEREGTGVVTQKSIAEKLFGQESLYTAVLFGQAYNTWVKAIEKVLRPFGITVSQSVTLRALRLAGRAMTPTEISHVLPVDQSAVSLLLDRLEERKLIKRRRGVRNDKRNVEIVLTIRGENLIDTVSPILIGFHAKVFDILSKSDQSRLQNASQVIRDTCVDILEANQNHAQDTLQMIVGPSKKPSAANSNKRHSKT